MERRPYSNDVEYISVAASDKNEKTEKHESQAFSNGYGTSSAVQPPEVERCTSPTPENNLCDDSDSDDESDEGKDSYSIRFDSYVQSLIDSLGRWILKSAPGSFRRYLERRNLKPSRLTKQQIYIFTCAGVCFLVGTVNLIIALVGQLGKRRGDNGMLLTGLDFEHSCGAIRLRSKMFKIGINALSAILVEASNYTMQILAAPTRKQLDLAHQFYDYLEIGGRFSPFNAHAMGRVRFWLGMTLFISTVPIYLLYNAAVSPTIVVKDFRVVVADERFFKNSRPVEWSSEQIGNVTLRDTWYPLPEWRRELSEEAPWWKRLSSQECREAIADQWNSVRDGILLVTSERVNQTDYEYSNLTDQDPPGPERTQAPGPIWYAAHFDARMWTLRNRQLVESWLLKDGLSSSGVWDFHPLYTESYIAWESTAGLENGRYLYPLHDGNQTEYQWSIKPLGDTRTWQPRRPKTLPVTHCFAREVEELCKLHFNTVIFFIVAVLAYTKAALMAIVGAKHAPKVGQRSTENQRIVTLGDAIESFIDNPDPITRGLCLVDSPLYQDMVGYLSALVRPAANADANIRKSWVRRILDSMKRSPSEVNRSSMPNHDAEEPEKLPIHRWRFLYKPQRIIVQRLYPLIKTGVRTRDPVGYALLAIFLVASAGLPWSLIFLHFRGRKKDLITITEFGNPSFALTMTMVGAVNNWFPFSTAALMKVAMAANSFQLVLTLYWLALSSSFAKAFLVKEWASFESRRQGLRVTDPKPGTDQRATYWISVPILYAIPLMATNGFLHFLLSLGLFPQSLVQVPLPGLSLDPTNTVRGVSVGYAPAPLAYFCAAVIIVLFCFRRLVRGISLGMMPPARGNSFLIAAACHPPEDEYIATPGGSILSEQKLKWGQTKRPEWLENITVENIDLRRSTEWLNLMNDNDRMEQMKNVQHLSFSSRKVRRPLMTNNAWMGLKKKGLYT